MQKMKNWTIIFLLTLVACGYKNNETNTDQEDNKTMSDTYPEKFYKELTADDKQILTDFKQRRTIFDDYIKSIKIEVYTCPSCGYPTLSERGTYEICGICNWEDDGQDNKDADKILGGPNGDLSLTQSRLIIGHELQRIADSLNGTIITDPGEFNSILKEHNNRMEIVESKIKDDTEFSDPLWDEWRQTREIIKSELINNKE